MGCGVVRVEPRIAHEFKANSRKLPKVVLEGFGQVIKGGLITTSKIVQVKKSAPSEDLITMRGEVRPEEKLEVELKKTEENLENAEEFEIQQTDQLLIIENKVIETSELEKLGQEHESDPEPSLNIKSDPDGPTEKPVFTNMSPVLILGFE